MPQELAWYRKRKYLHFDFPVSLQQATEIVADSGKVSQHAFYPLISYAVITQKIKKNHDLNKLIKEDKERPIRYACHMDSHIYSYYALSLSEIYERKIRQHGLQDNVLAFRTLGKSNIEFAKEAFDIIRSKNECGVVGLDVTKFFDNLDHSVLKRSWASLLGTETLPKDHYNIFKSLTKYSFVDRSELYKKLGISPHNPRNGRKRICSPAEFRDIVRKGGLLVTNSETKGIPQGTAISSLLSNIYMIEFDCKLKRLVESFGGHYFRYCDDILAIAPTDYIDSIERIISDELGQIKLQINPQKTEKRIFATVEGRLCSEKPLQYLGFTFDGSTVLIRSAALARYSEKMKSGVRFAKLTMDKRNHIKSTRGIPNKELFKRNIYSKYSYLGGRNFVTYGHRAARIMESVAIKRQLKPLWGRLQKEIDKYK